MAEKYGLKLKIVAVPKFEIQADKIEDVVRYSASLFFSLFKEPLLLDDSGLFIESLKGFPGPYTNFVKRTLDIYGILKLMTGESNRKAHFETALAYIDENEIKVFKGTVDGRIAYEPKGERGFGFDPIFIPNGSEKTFAEMSIEEKNTYSHRGKAFKEFIKFYLY
ncbi:XTP/dITP diphosphatase [Acidianus sp. RZ1]